jgi:hypothetical protein
MLADSRKSIVYLEDSQASPIFLGNIKAWMKMSVQHWYNGSDRGKTEENLSEYDFLHHQMTMGWVYICT